MRIQGIANFKDIRYAILEQNGKLSFLKESDSPQISRALIIDAKPDTKNLKESGLDIEWLNKRLSERHIQIEDVFLMTINEDGEINVIEKEKED